MEKVGVFSAVLKTKKIPVKNEKETAIKEKDVEISQQDTEFIYSTLEELKADSFYDFERKCTPCAEGSFYCFSYEIERTWGGVEMATVYYNKEADRYFLARARTETITRFIPQAGLIEEGPTYYASYVPVSHRVAAEMAACRYEWIKSQKDLTDSKYEEQAKCCKRILESEKNT